MRLVVLVLVACSSSPAPAPAPVAAPPPPRPACTSDAKLGGYEGTDDCKAIANTTIPAADRACRTNADCIRLGSHCAPFTVRADRSDAYASFPCTSRASGQCPPPCAAVCRDGCCAIPEGWGDNCR